MINHCRKFVTSALLLGLLLDARMLNAQQQTAPDAAGPALASEELTRVTGFWHTQDREGVVELYDCDGKICGKFRWIADDGSNTVSRDDKNPDPEKRKRPLCNMQFMGDFTPDGRDKYTNGWIYSPRHGAIFNGSISLTDSDTLELHGYILMPLLGQSQVWQRGNDTPTCKMP